MEQNQGIATILTWLVFDESENEEEKVPKKNENVGQRIGFVVILKKDFMRNCLSN